MEKLQEIISQINGCLPSTFNKLVDFGNPDESEWVFAKRYSLDYEGIKFTAVAWYYHPGSAYELRTKNPEKYNNSGNQCIYDKKGTLCTNIPTAGTADKISPNFSPGQHYNIDVAPFNLAKGLGFSYVEKYYKVRPIW